MTLCTNCKQPIGLHMGNDTYYLHTPKNKARIFGSVSCLKEWVNRELI